MIKVPIVLSILAALCNTPGRWALDKTGSVKRMKEMLQSLLGKSPVTSVIGILLASLGIVHEALKSGETDWFAIISAVLVGLLGLKAKDGASPEPK